MPGFDVAGCELEELVCGAWCLVLGAWSFVPAPPAAGQAAAGWLGPIVHYLIFAAAVWPAIAGAAATELPRNPEPLEERWMLHLINTNIVAPHSHLEPAREQSIPLVQSIGSTRPFMRPASAAAARRGLRRIACSSSLGATPSRLSNRPNRKPCLSSFASPRCSFCTTAPRREDERQWSTPLAKQLFEAISTTGPVPLASYMRMCLTGDLGGYYTGAIGQERDQFGVKGDFVTSPEISQIFGELIGVWFIAEWMSQGQPKQGVQLIEVGPGRGTLMDDMLRTIKRFPAMADSIEQVFMVEASPQLREAQKKLLCGADTEFTKTESGLMSSSGKHIRKPVVWAESLKSIPIEAHKVPFIVAHEFFDALPIHIFQSALAADTQSKSSSSSSALSLVTSSTTGEQSTRRNPACSQPSYEWREMMVSPTSPAAIASAQAKSMVTDKGQHPAVVVDEFQLILSSKPTRHSRHLPESSPRYRHLKQIPGSIVEICPDASLYAADFATRIGGSSQTSKPHPSGAALILDYGTSDTIPINSLRGIRHHRLVGPFSAPGLVDLSADVDFTALAEAATLASPGVEVHGPVSQADFLELMGIRERAEMLIKAARASPTRATAANSVEKSWKRLVDRGPNGMGKVYKALAIVPENDGRRRPVGFGGDVMQTRA
ncbi:hypothetical protein E4U21_007883 [Claviceps maximensis]|nr:hypothetical protein E4U21_007883 [Claviceps maximensis]